MPEPDSDPIASTQMFRAFVQGGEAETDGTRSRLRSPVVMVSLILALAAVAAVVVWLIVR